MSVRTQPLGSKLRPPRPHVALVARDGLVATLLASRAPLLLLSAPAGSGKTTGLLQWIAADPRPAAWLQLDAADNDPVVMLTYLARALAQVAPVDAEVFALLDRPGPQVEDRILAALAASVEGADPFLLILDDGYVLRAAECWSIVAELVGCLPPGAQIAIGTRVDPPLPLARMRASGGLAEMRADTLAFDRGEAAALLGLQGVESVDATVDALLDATEGWATGLYLAALGRADAADRPHAPGGGPRAWTVRGDEREIGRYLSAEVLDREPPDVQDFLLRTCVLERLDPGPVQLLSARDDAYVLLARLERENLFVAALDDRGETFRYQHLFIDLLRSELARRHPEELRPLHAQAAAWYLDHDDLDQAVNHLVEAGDVAAAAGIVASSWPALWSRGQAATVRRWLGLFTDRQILGDVPLTLTAGWVYSAGADASLGDRWARAACSARAGDEPSADGAASQRSSQLLLRATIGPDGIGRMRDDAEAAARLETAPGSSWHVDASLALGTARWLAGAGQRAVHPLEIAAREGAAFNSSAELAALGILALLAVDDGDWPRAREYQERAAARHAELGFGSARRCLPMRLAEARILAHEGEPAAERLAALCTEIGGMLETVRPHQWAALVGWVLLGEACVEHGDLDAARRSCEQASMLLRRYPDAGMLRTRAEQLRKAIARVDYGEPLTPAERRVLELLPTHLSEAQIAERLFVSQNTVKTHLRGVYRKLEAGSRAEAVERARQVGLLKQA